MANENNKSKKYLIPLIIGGIIGIGGVSGGLVMAFQPTNPIPPTPSDVVTLTFNGNTGTIQGQNVVATEPTTLFKDVIKPAAVKPGSSFIGWFEDVDCRNPISDSMPVKDIPNMKVYAGYTVDVAIHVHFDKGETGAEIIGNDDVVVTAEETPFKDINKPNAILAGQVLLNWSKQKNSNVPMLDDDVIPAEGITLYPFFTPAPTDYVMLTFDKNGGNDLQGVPQFNVPITTKFSTMSKPIATKKGKDFKFWSLDSDPRTATPIKDDQTFNVATKIYAIYQDVNFEEKIYYVEGEGPSQKQYWLTNPTDTTNDLMFQDTDGNAPTESITRTTFNKTLIIGSQVKSIGINFLYGCVAFNNGGQKLVIPASVESIGDSFMHLCIAFNQEVDMSACSNLSNIGSSFMQYCTTFNNNLIWPTSFTPGLELTIGAFFFQSCLAFNQKMELPIGVIKTIPSSFMADCEYFNNGADHQSATPGETPFVIPASVEKISSYFLSNCFAGWVDGKLIGLNQPITIPSTVKSIGEDFLYGNGALNSPVVLQCPITEIPDAFMSGCTRFTGNYTGKLTIPNTVTDIGDYFLYQCQSFNQAITIPTSVTHLGGSFLSGCYSFNQNITIPNSITRVGTYFMYYCSEMVSTLTINCQASAFASSTYTLSSGSPDSPNVVTGITIAGNSQSFRNLFGNMRPSTHGGTTTTPPYRYLHS